MSARCAACNNFFRGTEGQKLCRRRWCQSMRLLWPGLRDGTLSNRATPNGWLATSNVYPRIGVVGSTPTEAMEKLAAETTRWMELEQA